MWHPSLKIWTGSWLLQLQPDREVRLLTPGPHQVLHRLHCIVSTEFGTNLEDDEEQEIFDDPLAVQTEVIELSSQKSPVWECIDVTPIKDLLLWIL